MSSFENQHQATDDPTVHQGRSGLGGMVAPEIADFDLVIQDLDQCSNATLPWTYCG